MNHALVIARREIRDRSRLFVLAAALAFIPFIASLMPGARGYQSDIIAMGGAILGIALGVGTAITLGNTTIGRELSERRLSFYFAKPLSPAALWTGKAAAALLSSLACFLIVVLPALLAVRDTWSGGFFNAPAILLAGIIGIVVLFFVSHAVSTIIRSRSPLIALDVAALALAVGAVYLILRPVALTGSIKHTVALLLVILGSMLVLLVVVPVKQLATGRTDARRGHAAFSRMWWPALAVVIAAVGIYSAWLVRPAVTDISYVQDLRRAPAGDWVAVSGQTRHRGRLAASFVMNTATGETVRLPQTLWWGSTFSHDGRAVAWIRPASLKLNGQYLLHVRRLDQGRVYDTGIRLSHDAFVLSDDASRLAILQKKILSVYDIATGRLVASAATEGTTGRFFFASPDVVRLYQSGGDEVIRISELDTATRSFRQTGEFPKNATLVGTSADGSRAYVRGAIVDGRTGATIATLPEWKPELPRSRMLSDGSVARSGFEGGKAIVKIFDAEGTPRHELVLPGVKHTSVAGDTADGKLIVLASRAVRQEQKVFVIDRQRGVVEQVREGLAGPFPAWETDPRATPFRGELASVELRSGKPVLWNHDNRAEARPLFPSR
ncbi:MAG TPA: hypothetical protein VF883_14825 [Thermoanaerobaculia bacterium]